MAREQVFPVNVSDESGEDLNGVSTLCFPYKVPLNEKGTLVTSIELEKGSVIRADFQSLQKYRSWKLIVGKVLHKKSHCARYEVFVENFIENQTKSKRKNK